MLYFLSGIPGVEIGCGLIAIHPLLGLHTPKGVASETVEIKERQVRMGAIM